MSHLDLFGFRQHRDGRGRSVDTALGLGLGDALDPVGSALVLEDRVGAVAPDLEGDVLEAAMFGRRLRENLGRVAPLGGVAGQHLVEVAGEQRRFVATGAGPDLDDHVLVVVGVRLDHRQADLFFELAPDAREPPEPPSRSSRRPRPLRAARGRPRGRRSECGTRSTSALARSDLAVLATDLGVTLPVRDHRGIAHLPLELGEPRLDLFGQFLITTV